MLILHRWWLRIRSQLFWAVVILSIAWFLRQTQSAAIVELYSLISRPFQEESQAALENRLTNARITQLEQQLSELEQQNQQLKQLLNYAQKNQQPMIAAPVIGRSTDAWWHQVILGRGAQDGIKEGFIVMGVGGLVGRIVDVTPHSSRVLLISDPNSDVGASVTRTRTMGLIRGKSSDLVVMQFFEKAAPARPGDSVTTSTVSRLFPPSLPIGIVKSINPEKGPAPEATIELTAPLAHLEWVLVQPYDPQL